MTKRQKSQALVPFPLLVTYVTLDKSLNHSHPCQILVLSVKIGTWGEKREGWILSNTVPLVF